MLELVLALALTLIHFLSGWTSQFMGRFHFKIISLNAGIFIAIIFLFLLPEIVAGSRFVNIYMGILSGFALFHITEKYIYQHVKDKKRLLKDLAELHIAGFFVDSFIIGFAIVLIFSSTDLAKFFIFMPFVLHTLSSSIALEHIHEKSRTYFNKTILSFSPFLGAVTAIILQLKQYLFYLTYSFAVGGLLYIVIRDMLPKNEEGDIRFFLIGVLITLVTILLLS